MTSDASSRSGSDTGSDTSRDIRSDTSEARFFERLGQLACEARPSEAALQRMRRLMLDTLGCAAAARSHPAAVKAAAAARAIAPEGHALGLASGRRLGAVGAILDSGAAIRALDFNDFYWGPGLGGHPSDLFAVAFSMAAACQATLAQLLQSVVVGYGVYLGLVDALPVDGVCDHTTASRWGAAAIAGRLLGLDAASMTHAFALAAVQGPSMYAIRHGRISEAKAALPSMAAVDGFVAAQLARGGIDGPLNTLESPHGLGPLLRPGCEIEAHMLAAGRFSGDPLAGVTIKRYPCIGTAQAAVAVAAALGRSAAERGAAIEAVDVRLADNAIARHQTTEPYRRATNRETADHSFYALMGIALIEGDLAPAHFDRRRYLDADVMSMSDRLRFTCDLPGAADGRFTCHAVARLASGETVEARVDHPPGDRRNPLGDEDLVRKFDSCAAGSLDAEARRRIVELALRAPDTTRAADLLDLFARPDPDSNPDPEPARTATRS